VASFSIIADFAKNVGGDRVDITTLVGPNGDAHVYAPKQSDAAAVGAADVVLVNGLQFEGFLQRLVEASGTKAPVVELTKGGEVLKNAEGEHEQEAAEAEHKHEEGKDHAHEEGHHHHGEFDPHAWQSVHNAEIYVKNIADAFCAADAAGCDTYKANAEAYGENLEVLEGEIEAAVAEIAEDKRIIITSHDAFGYFEHEYGLMSVLSVPLMINAQSPTAAGRTQPASTTRGNPFRSGRGRTRANARWRADTAQRKKAA
jgi:zinc/manganese transport system substrate-binding protein